MNKFFLVPICIFFFVIGMLVLYFQFIEDKWKYFYKAKDKLIPTYCDDNSLNYEEAIIDTAIDKLSNRNFVDNHDSKKNTIHLIYFLPCDVENRNLDVNGKIEKIINNINDWFYNQSLNQKIKFDYYENKLDITFLRVNKTLSWFNKFSSVQKKDEDNSSKIEKIILSNNNFFNNFDTKKFIIFFEGWEKMKGFNTTCGRARLNGQVGIFYTNSNIKRKNTCVNIKKFKNNELGSEEQTVLHELLHLLGFPNQCAKNIDPTNLYHINDTVEDILYKFSGGRYLDFNNDDYYNHKLKNCPDLKNSNYIF